MQITLVSSGDTVSDAWDLIPIINYIETVFDIEFFSFCEQHNNCVQSIAQDLSKLSIHRLKEMTDSLSGWFVTSLLPKRNSKISLSCWISEVFLHIYTPVQVSAAEDTPMIAEKAIAVADESTETSNIDPAVVTDQSVDSSSPEIEVLEPEDKPVYTISIVADGAFSEERVNRLPPFLIDRKGNLLKKFWHRSCDAGYSEITSKHLSNIAVESGLVIKLMSDNLEVSQACIVGDPPPFIVDRGGVYKRDQVRRGLAVSYSQVISEYLLNIVVV